MMPCWYCNNGQNAIFDGWEIITEGTLEALCARYICPHCGTPCWVQVALREADPIDEEDSDDRDERLNREIEDDWIDAENGEDDKPADFSAGWEV